MLPKVTVRAYAQWSIRYKLMASLLMLSVTTLAVTGTIAYIKNLNAVKTNVTNQLAGVTLSRLLSKLLSLRSVCSLAESPSGEKVRAKRRIADFSLGVVCGPALRDT